MAKTLIDIDEELLAQARDALGTTTKKDTVNAALREVLALQERRSAVADLVTWTAQHEPLDSDARRTAWRQ